MSDGIPQEISTSGPDLRLARLTRDQADDYFELIQTNVDHLTQHGDYSELVAMTRCEIRDELAEQDDEVVYGIEHGSCLVGSVSLIRYTSQVYGLGYWISGDYAGRGYVTACCRALIQAAEKHLDATEVWAGISHGNGASVAVVKKLGFELARDQPSHLSFVLRLDG